CPSSPSTRGCGSSSACCSCSASSDAPGAPGERAAGPPAPPHPAHHHVIAPPCSPVEPVASGPGAGAAQTGA
ncbi:MAG: hypothetical protein AVDCRST_MAG20-1116, partial [uncultured Acidimicrobiales bacterium]